MQAMASFLAALVEDFDLHPDDMLKAKSLLARWNDLRAKSTGAVAQAHQEKARKLGVVVFWHQAGYVGEEHVKVVVDGVVVWVGSSLPSVRHACARYKYKINAEYEVPYIWPEGYRERG